MFGLLISYYKRSYKNWDLKTSSRPLFYLKSSKHNLYWKMKFLKQATYIRYVIAKLLKFIQIKMQASSDSFLQRILWKLKGPGTSFQVSFFTEYFDKIFSLAILHKLAKFNYQKVFTSQVQWNLIRVSYLGIWFRHDIGISENLKFKFKVKSWYLKS